MQNSFAPGDRVAMAAHWLRATQAHGLGQRKGTVYHVGERVVAVEWDDGRVSGILASNLVPVDRMHLELF
jgi:hypothetical protein